jgi:hypothetical protein
MTLENTDQEENLLGGRWLVYLTTDLPLILFLVPRSLTS